MAESLMVSQATQDTVNDKQNSSDNALNTTAKTVIGAINEHESDISTLNSNLAQYITAVRFEWTPQSVPANGDRSIIVSDLISLISIPSGYKLLTFFPEGVRPTTTWNAKPQLFYNNSANNWDVHNNGSSADVCTATFIAICILNL